MMWSLHSGDNGEVLNPLVFSNGKNQEDIVKEVVEAIKEGNKIIFINGVCGTGKSAIALNIAKEIGKTSIIVPIKSLQEQYSKDYSGEKYVLKNETGLKTFSNRERLKISSIVGRKNFKCRFLKEFHTDIEDKKEIKEKDTKLNDVFEGGNKIRIVEKNDTCDNLLLPCKVEIKEKNLGVIKDYIKQNPSVKITNFDSVKDVRRMSIAPVCPYWSPILSDEFEIKKFKDARKIKYKGIGGQEFVFYQRMPGCGFYDQYEAYGYSDVIIFNSMKYKLETLMGRKPETEVEIIDECDEFLDSFANKEQLSLSRLSYALGNIFVDGPEIQKIIDKLIDTTNALKLKYQTTSDEIFEIKNSLVEELLDGILEDTEFLDKIEADESNYIYHLDEVARIFYDFMDETFFSVEKTEKDIVIHLVTVNLAKRFKELAEKNKVLVLMSGTLHSESVLKTIFGIEDFKVIDAETKPPGEIVKMKTGLEINCAYNNFQQGKITRDQYLKALNTIVSCARKPVLVHVNAFNDLPTDFEKLKLKLDNLPTRFEIVQQQINDPFGEKIKDFRNKKTNILFTTKCSRGVDFPGDVCNSIVITRYPYPNISGIFWKILKKINPQNFMSFYMDKAKRELLQKIYRGLRSEDDKIYLMSPDIRVFSVV